MVLPLFSTVCSIRVIGESDIMQEFLSESDEVGERPFPDPVLLSLLCGKINIDSVCGMNYSQLCRVSGFLHFLSMGIYPLTPRARFTFSAFCFNYFLSSAIK